MAREVLRLQSGIIYGPVNSRRLGSSLGINILPTTYKACPFNCIYCQYGYTKSNGYKTDIDIKELPSTGQVEKALKEALEEYPSISYITFSGNGDATLHPDFGNIVMSVKKIRDQWALKARLAILSNSALIFKNEIRNILTGFDDCFMKLDAGDEATFRRFNRPHNILSFEAIKNGLKAMDNVVIQALFAGGTHGNSGDSEIESWSKTIAEIKPSECHIYSLDRPSADKNHIKLSKDELTGIKLYTENKSGITVRVF